MSPKFGPSCSRYAIFWFQMYQYQSGYIMWRGPARIWVGNVGFASLFGASTMRISVNLGSKVALKVAPNLAHIFERTGQIGFRLNVWDALECVEAIGIGWWAKWALWMRLGTFFLMRSTSLLIALIESSSTFCLHFHFRVSLPLKPKSKQKRGKRNNSKKEELILEIRSLQIWMIRESLLLLLAPLLFPLDGIEFSPFRLPFRKLWMKWIGTRWSIRVLWAFVSETH